MSGAASGGVACARPVVSACGGVTSRGVCVEYIVRARFMQRCLCMYCERASWEGSCVFARPEARKAKFNAARPC